MPTPLNIQGTTVANIPDLFRAYSEVQPFTYRSGATYTQILESMRVWILDDLVPYLNTNFSDIQDNWVQSVQEIVDGINDALQAAINAIAASDVIITDPAIIAALNATNSQSLDYFSTRYGYVLQGSGIDPTGVADSTAAVRAFFDAIPAGATVKIPSSAIIKLTGGIVLNKSVHIEGPGELRWTAGIANDAAFACRADGITFDRVRLTNPNHLAGATGNRSYGIYWAANYGAVRNSVIDGFQAPVWVDANGEWHHHTVTGNQCLNVVGTGGEDRGDGIYMAGAVFVVSHNLVELLDGTDGRIGIGAESLQGFVQNPGYRYQDQLGVISNNIVMGAFRRSIANEGMPGVTISNNVCIGATFWGINVVGSAHRTTVSNNVIIWTSSLVVNPNPICSGIFIYDFPNDVIIDGNIIYSTVAGSAMSVGIGFQQAAGIAKRVKVVNNRIFSEGHSIVDGILIASGGDDITINDNEIGYFTGKGVNAYNANVLTVCRNKISGYVATHGIFTNGSANAIGRFDGNTVVGCGTGLALVARSTIVTASNNLLYGPGSGVGLDMLNAAPGTTAQAAMNLFKGWAVNTQNLPTGTVTTGNN